jgi:hypothetical protein
MLVSVKSNTCPTTATSQKLIRTAKFSKLNRWTARNQTVLHRKCPIVRRQQTHITEVVPASAIVNLNRWAARNQTLLLRKCPIVPHHPPAHITELVLVPAIVEEEEDDPDREGIKPTT